MKYEPDEQAALLGKLQQDTPNNHEQENYYREITQSILSGETKKFFLIGQWEDNTSEEDFSIYQVKFFDSSWLCKHRISGNKLS